MKRYISIIITLTFANIFFSYSFASALDKDDVEIFLDTLDTIVKKEEQKNKEEAFNKKVDEILRKLPTSAKIAVPEIKLKVPELDMPESDPELEDSRIRTIKALQSISEKLRDSLETHLEDSGITVVERDAFKEVETEIVYSQTGEVDPNSSAKFGKAIGATHLVLCKVIYDGFRIGHPAGTISIRVVEVESMKRIGSANFTLELAQDE